MNGPVKLSPKIALVANTDWYLFNFKQSFFTLLRDRGYDVLLIGPAGRYAENIRELGFRFIDWPVSRQSINPFLEITALFKLFAIYRRESLSLVHHFTVKPVLYGSLAARLAGVPAVCNAITGQGYALQAEERRAKIIRPLVKLLYRTALRHPNLRVIFENEMDRSYFLHNRLISADRCDLIEGVGVDTARFFPVPEPEGVPVVVFVGRILWDKGVGVLAESARQLKNEMPVHFVLVGKPDPGNPTTILEGHIQSWVEEGIFEWKGWIDDVKAVYDDSNIVVLPSFYEGVPTVLLEAAACGRAIVASDIPGNRVVVEDGVNGLLVPLNDPGSLTDAIRKLLDNAVLRKKMGKAGRERVMASFTTEKVNSETLQVYKKLLLMGKG